VRSRDPTTRSGGAHQAFPNGVFVRVTTLHDHQKTRRVLENTDVLERIAIDDNARKPPTLSKKLDKPYGDGTGWLRPQCLRASMRPGATALCRHSKPSVRRSNEAWREVGVLQIYLLPCPYVYALSGAIGTTWRSRLSSSGDNPIASPTSCGR
jgi:hypothetical protein